MATQTREPEAETLKVRKQHEYNSIRGLEYYIIDGERKIVRADAGEADKIITKCNEGGLFEKPLKRFFGLLIVVNPARVENIVYSDDWGCEYKLRWERFQELGQPYSIIVTETIRPNPKMMMEIQK